MRGARPSFLRERGLFLWSIAGREGPERNSPEGETCRQTEGCPGYRFFAYSVKRGVFDPARRTSKTPGMKRAPAGRKPFLCRGAYEMRSGQGWSAGALQTLRPGGESAGLAPIRHRAAARLSLRGWAAAGAGDALPCGSPWAKYSFRSEGTRPPNSGKTD